MLFNPQSEIRNPQSGNPKVAIRIMIAGGGTGGHIYIGVALARELKQRDPSTEFLFVGTRRGLEARIVPQEGFRLEFIDSGGLKRVGAANLLRNLLRVPRSLVQSRRLISDFGPDVVVGVGGYSSGPVVLTARLLGTPCLIVEPNAQPGLTNRFLSPLVNRVAIALPDAAGYFRGKAVVTGIPVREEFRKVPGRQRASEHLTLLVYGGSQGSHALNTVLCDSLTELKKMGPRLRLIHQTGEKELDLVRNAYRKAGVEADIRPFLPRIFEEFAVSDLILSRAGAATVAELTVAGRPAILVPLPGAADDHQTKNAVALEKAGAARTIRQSELTPARLAQELDTFMSHPEQLRQMELAARSLARPDAAQKIGDLILDLAHNTTRGVND